MTSRLYRSLLVLVLLIALLIDIVRLLDKSAFYEVMRYMRNLPGESAGESG